MILLEENFDWAHQAKLEKYEDLWEQWVRNGWISNVFPIKVGCQAFITNLHILDKSWTFSIRQEEIHKKDPR